MRGHNHDFIGLNLGFREGKALEVGMKEFLEKLFEDSGKIMTPTSVLAKSNLFNADENSPKRKEHSRNKLHSDVALLRHAAL